MKSAASNAELKRAVGVKAADLVQDNMSIGIGTGSTVAYLIEEIGNRVKDGLKIKALTTSFQAMMLCIDNHIPLIDPKETYHLDIAIDGADEVDYNLNVIKGGGAAHTLEKLVASMADEFIIIADESKLVQELCRKFPLPIEILPQSLGFVQKKIIDLGGQPEIRMGLRKDGPVITDNGFFVLDITFKSPVDDIYKLNNDLKNIPGVLETGLFLDIAKKAYIGKSNGEIEQLTGL